MAAVLVVMLPTEAAEVFKAVEALLAAAAGALAAVAAMAVANLAEMFEVEVVAEFFRGRRRQTLHVARSRSNTPTSCSSRRRHAWPSERQLAGGNVRKQALTAGCWLLASEVPGGLVRPISSSLNSRRTCSSSKTEAPISKRSWRARPLTPSPQQKTLRHLCSRQ